MQADATSRVERLLRDARENLLDNPSDPNVAIAKPL
jgi:hypothetical protein